MGNLRNLGVFVAILAVLGLPLVAATPYYKQISKYTWYGEDLEQKGNILGGVQAFASAYFYDNYITGICYAYDFTNEGNAYGIASLYTVLPENGYCTAETVVFGGMLRMGLEAVAGVGPPRSA